MDTPFKLSSNDKLKTCMVLQDSFDLLTAHKYLLLMIAERVYVKNQVSLWQPFELGLFFIFCF